MVSKTTNTVLVKTWYAIAVNYDTFNLCAFIYAGVAVIVLYLGKRVNTSKAYRSRSMVPIPTELLVVAGATGLTAVTGWDSKYGMEVVGTIQQGFESPAIPQDMKDLSLWPKAIPMALVS